MSIKIIAIVILIVIGIATGIYKRTNQYSILKDLKPGSLLSITGYVKGKESKAKVLAIDQRSGTTVYSLKIYPQENPEYVTTKDGKQVEVSGIQHIPLTVATLKKWHFRVTGWEQVKDAELIGYKIWKNDPKAGAY